MSWRNREAIANVLKSYIQQESLPDPFRAELERILRIYSEGLANEIFALEKRIYDLERRRR